MTVVSQAERERIRAERAARFGPSEATVFLVMHDSPGHRRPYDWFEDRHQAQAAAVPLRDASVKRVPR